MLIQKNRFLILFFTIVTALLWSTPVFTTPTFDLDESLYRQSAQEMKITHNYFNETWSGESYYDKPPTHMWSIVAVSKLIDHDENKISVIAAKLPSLLSTYLTVFFACLFWFKTYPILKARLKPLSSCGEPYGETPEFSFPLLPALFFGWALLPTAGSSSVLVDPMLVAAMSPFFLILAYFYIKDSGKLVFIPNKFRIIMSISMSIACMLKGPIGILLPALSVILHEVISFIFQRNESTKTFLYNRLWIYTKIFFPIFLGATILSFIYYFVIYIYAGKEFIYQFFIVQNIHRGLRPFEGHGGTFFYHWIVVFLGGCFLTPAIVFILLKLRRSYSFYSLWGYPLSWCLTIILFFSFVSTKLPNYTWPVWVSLSVLMPILLVLLPLNQKTNKYFSLLFFAPILTAVSLFFCTDVVLYCVNHLNLDPRVKIVVDTVLPIPPSVRIAFIIAGFTFNLL
ncbi:MAG: hypothetical protein V4591_09075 [Bdellovibrionota bacterium]